MASQETKAVGLRPSERYNRLAAAKVTAVTEEIARAEEKEAWRDARDGEARSSGSIPEDDECRPCGESVTAKPAEGAPIMIATDPGDPTE